MMLLMTVVAAAVGVIGLMLPEDYSTAATSTEIEQTSYDPFSQVSSSLSRACLGK
jgi:hypothetical protein